MSNEFSWGESPKTQDQNSPDIMAMRLESYVGDWQGKLNEPVKVFAHKPCITPEEYKQFKCYYESGELLEKLQSEKGWGHPEQGGKDWYYTAGVMDFFDQGLHLKDYNKN